MIKKNAFIVIFIVLISFFFHIDNASAAPKLEVKAEVGVSNKIKYNTPLPLKLTVTNNGSAFSGDLVIDAAESYAVGSGLVYPLDIAEGETKTIQLYLNGLSDDYMYTNNQQLSLFYFYEGGIENGKLIDYTGSKNVRPQYLDQFGTFIFTLTENSDRLTAFSRLSQNPPTPIEVLHLNQIKNFEFPTDSKGLEMADILAIDEINLSDLSEDAQQAILEWVQQGGTLLIGASDQVEASVGMFKEYLPLTISTERALVSKESLKKLSNGGNFTEGIEVYQAKEKEDSIRVLADGDTILASATKIGSGRIIQTTFSLGDQPLSGMAGYSKLLDSIVKIPSSVNANIGYAYGGNFNDYLPNEVGSVNELFPSFEVSTPILVMIIVIYILFIGPILYFILKRKDKREHAWWVIPIVSVALSICMFVFGAKDRLLQSQIQQSAFYKVNADNSLKGYYVESILTNRDGNFTFTTDNNTTAVATRNMNTMGGPSTERLHEKSYVKEHANGLTMSLRNLNYWSVQSIIGETNIPNAGNMDIQLKIVDGTIQGTIKNNFPFKLKDVAIWSGTREIKLGDIKANGTLQVSETIKGSILVAPSTANNNYSTPQKKKDLLPIRIEKLKYGASNLIEDEQLPAITAWTEEALVGIELDGNAKVSPVSYIIQTFKPDVKLSGEFTLDKDTLEEIVEPKSQYGYMELMNEQANEWFLEDGEYDYNVSIPKELLDGNAKWTEINVTNKDINRLELAIWNVESSQYEDITNKSTTLNKNLEQYISTDGQVKVLLRFSDNQKGTPVVLPEVQIKGVAK